MPRNRTMTKAHKAKLHELRMTVFACRDAVYRAFPDRTDVPYRDCYAASPLAVREAMDRANEALEAFERDMVAEGRAFRTSTGGILAA